MSPAVTQIVLALIDLIPKLIQIGEEAIPFVENLIASIKSGNEPTQADWDSLDKLEALLRAKL